MAVKFFYLAKKLRTLKLNIFARAIELILRYLCGCEIHGNTKIGKGLQLPHNGLGVVINPNTIIGNNVKIHQNVTIGGREGSGAPVIEDNVLIGTGAVILGDIIIHKGVKIGANAVVICDIPENTIAVGVPAIIKNVRGVNEK